MCVSVPGLNVNVLSIYRYQKVSEEAAASENDTTKNPNDNTKNPNLRLYATIIQTAGLSRSNQKKNPFSLSKKTPTSASLSLKTLNPKS